MPSSRAVTEPSAVHNDAVLRHLQRELLAGSVREGASAVLMFDPSESEDARSFEQIRSLNPFAVEWVELVEYDERGLCEERHRIKPPSKKNARWESCDRAKGVFAVMSVRIRLLRYREAAGSRAPSGALNLPRGGARQRHGYVRSV